MSGVRERFGILAAALFCLAATAAAQQDPRGPVPPSPDSFGYRLYDQNAPACGFDFVEIEPGGTPISFTASGADAALDDGGAVVSLSEAFELYGEPLSSLVVSTNGYLAGAGSLAAEDGGDFSNDATLPAIPDNAAGVPLRILPYHEELSGLGSGGSAYHQFFAVCPRPSEALGAEACTVIQWSDWALRGSGSGFDLQIVLYHGSFEIALQIRPGIVSLSGGTIGIQDRAARTALQYRPAQALAGDTAVCIFDPRFPPGGPVADLEITNADTVEIATPGVPVTYEIGLRNRGPSPAPGAAVSDPLPPTLVDCSWTCASSEGSACAAAAGTGTLGQSVNLAPGGWVDFVMTCDTVPAAGSVVHTVSAAVPPGVADPRPDNDAATDVNLVGAGRLSATLTFARDGAGLQLFWQPSCLASDADYAIYRGTLGDFSSHEPVTCGTGGALSRSVPLPDGDVYFLVVPTNLFNEGSYGRSSSGEERPASFAACLPQALGLCP